ncbi:MAG: phosphoribosyl-AMP cyclohydrolase [Ilumatobacteraceae bacterium]|nr:phosphoribosyl-AMP cyclohydrolase [Ilumatobacteraceae bacterium]MDP4703363.1 phosphoribosyl-AMP cyclohydrolase [Ilumatobacteraceae bacterium]MDP5109334.1 phosphoribosyl-AMP cyclohydrolase [Ilumatobacteraceae bacterium]
MSQTPATTPVAIVEAELALVKYNADGLVPVVTQDANTKQVLMMAWMNAETLRMTLAEGRMVYYSRSRKEVWRKGDTSGDRQFVREGFYDCDVDTLLFLVEQEGNGACHTGAVSCFYRKFGEGMHDAH